MCLIINTMHRDLTDRALFEAIKRGDENALEILFRSYYNQLCLSVESLVE